MRPSTGDHDLNPGMRPPSVLKPAAVLVPIVERHEGMTILLTQRTEHLNDHAGQISFPGGRVEPSDPDVEFAALREAEEDRTARRRNHTLPHHPHLGHHVHWLDTALGLS